MQTLSETGKVSRLSSLRERAGGYAHTIALRGRFVLLLLPVGLMVILLALPLLAIFLKTLPHNGLWKALHQPLVTQALWLSLVTSASSLAVAVGLGTPLAYILARYRFRGVGLLDTLMDVPMVLPPTVAGIALLMAFGRRGLLGPWLEALGIQIGFTPLAVILAQSFVSTPFYTRAAQAAFRSVDQDLERVAYTLGYSPFKTFLYVTVPLAFPSLLSGAVMAWTRALGEFGATIMFAGNLLGRTQTMPLAIYLAMESDLNAALALAVILILVPFSTLLLVRLLLHRGFFGTYA